MPRAAKNNRTDLAIPKSAAPGQAYGEAGDQLASEAEVPMAGSPVAPATPAPSSAAPAPVVARPAPGSLPYMGPTNRPNEPVTTGLPFGPGAGPEALTGPAIAVAQRLGQMASAGGSAVLGELASTARALGL
jgi:hypothetical protein